MSRQLRNAIRREFSFPFRSLTMFSVWISGFLFLCRDKRLFGHVNESQSDHFSWNVWVEFMCQLRVQMAQRYVICEWFNKIIGHRVILWVCSSVIWCWFSFLFGFKFHFSSFQNEKKERKKNSFRLGGIFILPFFLRTHIHIEKTDVDSKKSRFMSIWVAAMHGAWCTMLFFAPLRIFFFVLLTISEMYRLYLWQVLCRTQKKMLQ